MRRTFSRVLASVRTSWLRRDANKPSGTCRDVPPRVTSMHTPGHRELGEGRLPSTSKAADGGPWTQGCKGLFGRGPGRRRLGLTGCDHWGQPLPTGWPGDWLYFYQMLTADALWVPGVHSFPELTSRRLHPPRVQPGDGSPFLCPGVTPPSGSQEGKWAVRSRGAGCGRVCPYRTFTHKVVDSRPGLTGPRSLGGEWGLGGGRGSPGS